jgi:hypothetical protein
MVADSTIASDILENTGVAVGIIFLAYTGAKIEGESTELPLGPTRMREKPWALQG